MRGATPCWGGASIGGSGLWCGSARRRGVAAGLRADGGAGVVLCGVELLPGVAVVVGAEFGESLEVDGGGSVGEADPVGGHASVADAAVPVADEPGDGSFDHGAVLAVVVGVGAVAPVGSGLGEKLVVFADLEGPASGRCGASGPQGARLAA